MPRCSAPDLDLRIIPAGFNAPLEFLTGFIKLLAMIYKNFKYYKQNECQFLLNIGLIK